MNFKIVTATILGLVALGQTAPTVYTSNATDADVEFSDDVVAWGNPTFPSIYHTCNDTDIRMIKSAFMDSLEVSAYARDRLLNYGADDLFFNRWFGNGSLTTVLGTLDHLVEASKDGMLLRCDDIDGLCAKNPTTYPGYHRATEDKETVICDLFYQTKKPLSSICFEGNLVDVHPKHYAGVDMLHRYLHVSMMNLNGYIAEFAEDLDEIVEYAHSNTTYAVRNVDSYLYYMADVYSSSVIEGGCLGKL
ncbi:LAMI_0B06194g1_1 [Lachancea mirantina]|uniref:LAMI_0B06194g1_1 n=1 Tax=Lachancea mirantina TaxID=1230905 RepID=A0A1G4IWM1_9SACH|nr:LAMI_0B06194g1_1 [Lachancea mirantina]